ncbi:MAG: RNA methyltransferase [Candidatus Omnitrophica bacterium]|nr:RNA methyltransferase [Candidatus Omnitrophota bacterium]
MRKLTHDELVSRQQRNKDASKIPFFVVLNNIRSLYNVGSILRTADGVGVEKIWLCGITGIPPDPKISKTALGADKTVPWEYRENVRGLLEELKFIGYQIVLLEQTERSIPYEEFVPRPPVCLVLGNEISGVVEDILPSCDVAVEIEMAGLKNSLNVSVAFGIVAYHIRNCLKVKSFW